MRSIITNLAYLLQQTADAIYTVIHTRVITVIGSNYWFASFFFQLSLGSIQVSKY